MKKEDTRGLSTIVATLLIILLVILSVAIVWGVIRNIINTNSEQVSLRKISIDLEIVSMKQTYNDVSVKVKRNPGEGNLEGIIFSIFDGKETHLYERHNVSLGPLDVKTFVIEYTGEVVSISIYPILVMDSGKTTTGDVADTYHNIGDSQEHPVSPNCIPNCIDPFKECGDNGCGGNCGPCPSEIPYCVWGECKAESGLNPDCSCSQTTCEGRTCDDGIGGSCPGELLPDCEDGPIICGVSPKGCDCGVCQEGYYCNGGMCSRSCLSSECASRECGGLPGRWDCGETFCGVCTVEGETCNETSGECFVCIPDCVGKECGTDGCEGYCGYCALSYNVTYNCNLTNSQCEMCIPDCGAKECGLVPNGCGESCGNCTGNFTCSREGVCLYEKNLNNGTILSVWPTPFGRMYFDSEDLPKTPENYFMSYVKFPESAEAECLLIQEFVSPIFPTAYNTSYIKLATTSTNIEPGDKYEIWETYEGCTS